MSVESISDLVNQLDRMTIRMNQSKHEKQDDAVPENLGEMMRNYAEMQEIPENVASSYGLKQEEEVHTQIELPDTNFLKF